MVYESQGFKLHIMTGMPTEYEILHLEPGCECVTGAKGVFFSSRILTLAHL